MTKMTIYHVIVNSDHPVPVTAQIEEDNNIKLYNHLEKYGEVFKK